METIYFIQTLAEATNLMRYYKYVDETAKTNPFSLLSIFEFLSRQVTASDDTWQFRAVFERIIDAICLTKGHEQIASALKLCSKAKIDDVNRRVAALLAAGQITDDLVQCALKEKASVDPYLMCLIAHELVSRGHDLRKFPDFFEFASALNSKTKFKTLPLFPSKIELNIRPKDFAIGFSGSSNQTGLYNHSFNKLERTERTIRDFKEENQITLPLQQWVTESNGAAIGIKGNLEEQLNPIRVLSQLDYPPLYAKEFKLNQILPTEMFQALFGACNNGGAYSRGEYGATARLNTWLSIHAMTSETPFVDVEETENEASKFLWYEFILDKWFLNEWLDIGILGMSTTSTKFSILAGTDTD